MPGEHFECVGLFTTVSQSHSKRTTRHLRNVLRKRELINILQFDTFDLFP